MNIGDSLSIIKSFLVICAVVSIIIGIMKLVTASKKGLGKWYKIRTVMASVLASVVFLVFSSTLSGEMDNSSTYIKAQHPIGISDITYGQAIDKVCGNQKWSRATSQSTTTGNAIVQMDADCIYADGNHRITIQFNYGIEDFELIDANTPFEITFAGLDNIEETSVSEMQNIVYEMFAHYADSYGIILDKSARENILYSDGWKTSRATDNSIDTINTIGSSVAETKEGISEYQADTDSVEKIPDSLTANENLLVDDFDEIVYPPEGWQDPSEEIDVIEMGGSYAGSMEASSARLAIYSGPTEEEVAAGEVGSASIYIDPQIQVYGGASYEGLLITLGNNEYMLRNDAGQEVLLQAYYFRGLYFDVYIDGEYVETYYMVEQYIP